MAVIGDDQGDTGGGNSDSEATGTLTIFGTAAVGGTLRAAPIDASILMEGFSRSVTNGSIGRVLNGVFPGANTATFNPSPWLADLAEMRAALHTKYANLSWLLSERELDSDALLTRAENALKDARSEADAVRLFDQVIRRIGDGHIKIHWPRTGQPAAAALGQAPPPASPVSICAALGYRRACPNRGAAPALAGYVPLPGGDMLKTGLIAREGVRVGFIRIEQFDLQASPSL
jgi:hypothetical protein